MDQLMEQEVTRILTSRRPRRSATSRSSRFPNSIFGGNSRVSSWRREHGEDGRKQQGTISSSRVPRHSSRAGERLENVSHLWVLQPQRLVHLSEAAVAPEDRPRLVHHRHLGGRDQGG